MSSDNTTFTASDFPLALFSLGLPLTMAAFSLSGYGVPDNLAVILATGLAVLGLLLEILRGDDDSVAPIWFKAGIPALLITWISFQCFTGLTRPLLDQLPLLMEAKPLLFLLVTVLWLNLFPPPKPRQISFWASWLALLICAEFGLRFFLLHEPAMPSLSGISSITGPILLVGLCATLHNSEKSTFPRLLILAGIFCSLGRDIALTAVLILLISGPKGGLKKFLLILCMLFFSYLSLQVQEMTFMNRQDLPSYWLWFSILELFTNNPELLLSGFSLSVPLPLNVPASLWTIWHGQQHVWTGSGIYMFHILPFWLHLLSAWGLAGPCLAAAAGTAFYRRFPSNMLAGLLTTIVLCGFFSPLFYHPACALVLFPAFITASSPEVQSFRFE
ncbi:hypothetical protein [Desulfovibrio sp. JC022]|uniref:hypothetical protein n=1 Tax=Desulfovibrio sp. JC022 TaxID=2593642 RepID=UPI0013D68D1C|nr:hypothetical protein [Desulfovibrio sp. JC022]NDV23900.1 hypothetical protein [Desulfovibrio sp. JC022]